jgi:hypothetical protein
MVRIKIISYTHEIVSEKHLRLTSLQFLVLVPKTTRLIDYNGAKSGVVVPSPLIPNIFSLT